MKNLRFILFTGLILTGLSSCKSIKYLSVIDGSRSDGTITLMYEYGIFEKPVVQWEAAKKSAIEKCKLWGYSGAEFFDSGISQCIAVNRDGYCVRWRIIYKCQCTTDPSPSINEASIPKLSSGSGFAINSDGVIVTCQHIIEGAKEILVKGVNGDFSKSYQAKVLIEDKKNDLAILKINDTNFNKIDTIPFIIYNKTIDIGSSVYCLGYPLRATMGDEIKLTNGIISSKSGYQGDITSYQLTVPVHPGNSGAPLFDNNGNLVGVINAKHAGAENASYAIKSTFLLNLIEQLPYPIQLTEKSRLSDYDFVKQVNILKNYVYIIDVKH